MSVSSNQGPTEGVEGVDDGSEPPELSRDKIFHILQTQRRRDALRYLKEHDGPVEMRDLAEQVAAWENDTTVQALASDERQRVYIALYQSHLPKLDEEGVIEYNKSRGIVKRGAFAAQFDPYLDAPKTNGESAGNESNDGDVPWLSYYRRATTVGVVVVTAAYLGIPPVSLVPDIVWGILFVGAFTALSIAQLYSE